jgi:carbonic anhydrase
MSSLSDLFERNRLWAARMHRTDPDMFDRLSEAQNPRYLWIGCADSRVPANQVIDLPPGTVFVHRNIANVVHPADLSVLSVLQFAVEKLHVRDIIICGHYGCGGVAAAIRGTARGPLQHWLRGLRDLYRLHREELDALDDLNRANRLSELNVLQQVRSIVENPIVEVAWNEGRPLTVHGLIYDLENGHLHDLGLTVSRPVHA